MRPATHPPVAQRAFDYVAAAVWDAQKGRVKPWQVSPVALESSLMMTELNERNEGGIRSPADDQPESPEAYAPTEGGHFL